MQKTFVSNILKIRHKSMFFWIVGFLAFLWLLLRSGMNPKRLAYPCQQAAYPIASAWFIAVVSMFTGAVLLKKVFKVSIPVVLIAAISWVFVSSTQNSQQTVSTNYPVWESTDPTSEIYIFDDVPPTSGSLSAGNATVPDSYLSDPGIDSLIHIMEGRNNPFFKTTGQTNGIVGNNDVVILKCNFQWRHRLGTNTDRIKGVIWQILNHPETFNGEILVCDNQESQIWDPNWLAGFNDYSNNSDDQDQSIVDVVNTFKAKGYPVDYYVWDSLNPTTVSEYEEGDMTDGYIFNPETLTSYPKFLSPQGNYISLKHGLWDNHTQTYDKTNLTIINFPVLKAHGMAGATIALKNYIGVMNTTKHDEWFGGWVDDTFHPLYCFSEYALVAREMEICWPDLNIIDATWVATASNYNHNTQTIQANTILASTDPVAASWYAAKHILLPIASYPNRVDPDYQGNDYYGTILNYWYNYLADSTGFAVTKDSTRISVFRKKIIGNNDDNTTTNIPVNDEPGASGAMHAYPNPSDGMVHIDINSFDLPEKVFLSNSTGTILESHLVKSKKLAIDLSGYPNGMYYLFYNLDHRKETVKLIKRK